VNCTQIRGSLGVYVVGAIDPAERSQVDRHVAFCPSCRDELAALAGLPALLGRVTEDQITEIAHPRVEPFESALAQVIEERRAVRRRGRWERWRMFVAVAMPVAAAAMVVSVFVSRPVQEQPPPSPTPAPSPSTVARQEPQTELHGNNPVNGISATVTMRARRWGTALSVEVAGVQFGSSCKVTAIPKSGRSDDAASWRVTYREPTAFAGSTMFRPDEIARFEIRTTDDKRTLVTVPVS
jgi:hypothetical protein